MDFSAFQIQPGFATIGSLTLFLLSLLIWWLIRKKRQRIWLPTLRLIKLDSSHLPKIRIIKPPLILFLCFLLASATIAFFTFRPSQTLYQSTQPGDKVTFIFLDMSPSVFYQLNLDEYKKKAHEVFEYYQADSSVLLSTSLSEKIFRIADPQDLDQVLKDKMPHRAGLKLGQAIHQILEKAGAIDRLVILSDGDQFSWADFNWNYLESKFEVYYAPVRSKLVKKENYYIEDVRFVSGLEENSLLWEVDITRDDATTSMTGKILVSASGDLLNQKEFRFNDGQKSITIVLDIDRTQLNALGISSNNEQPLLWKLILDQGNLDRLSEDNEFRSQILGVQQDILLVSEPQGEMFLEDPVHHLKIALEILGFNVKRLDRFSEGLDESFFKYPLWIVSGGNTDDFRDFCPVQFADQRFKNLQTGDGLTQSYVLPNIWLVPIGVGANYRQLCHCYASLVERDPNTLRKEPIYCEDVQTRDQYISVLRSLGAKQIGGRVDRLLEAIAWHWRDQKLNHETLAFSMPLQPGSHTGLAYSQLPILVRSLVEWMGFLKDQSLTKRGSWPRVQDIVMTWSNSPISKEEVRLSNVPTGESMLMELEVNALPKSWRGIGSIRQSYAAEVQEEKDPRPWIDLCLLIIIAVTGIEGFVLLFKSLRTNSDKGKKLVGIGLIFGLLSSRDAHSDVYLNLLGYHAHQQYTGETLAREVSSRTSIELEAKVLHQSSINDALLGEGWIWVQNLSSILNEKGEIDSRIIGWIKRGGFLVIENFKSPNQITLPFISDAEEDGWKPIPPDHEIMRSFHLLDSLPKCQEQVWQGFHFDGRIAIIGIPFSLLDGLLYRQSTSSCIQQIGRERATRIFINIMMVALATDYKKDQIHLPEILKRLR